MVWSLTVNLLEAVPQYFTDHNILLSVLIWTTYAYAVWKAGFVSDDLMGIAEYSGQLQTSLPEDKTKDWPWWRRLIHSEYGMVSRWVRYLLAGGDFPSSRRFPNKPDGRLGDPIPMGKLPRRHHILSVLVFNLAVISTYFALTEIVGAKVAFIACVLLVVHPVSTQGVAWISGLGYPLCLFWMTLAINLVQWHYLVPRTELETLLVWMTFTCVYFLAVNALFVGLVLCVILAVLGYWPFAVLGGLVSLYTGAKIVRETITLRQTEFKKQNMGHSIYPKPRKVIVALKTLLYYLKMLFWPDKIGLYHKWGHHYSKDIERESPMLWGGLVAAATLIGLAFLGPMEVAFGVIWFFAFIWIFLNWITIQQFVTERYLMIPAIGIYIVIGYYFQDYPIILVAIGSLLIMRTWMHLPAYENELRFYLSNTWNFPDSEVAYTNLGVTYLRIGWLGSGLDSWTIATQINQNYDVPYYNIFSHYNSNARLMKEHGQYSDAVKTYADALKYLDKAIACEVCHFKEMWEKERADIARWVQNPFEMILDEEKRLTNARLSYEKMASETKDPKRLAEINQSLIDATQRLNHITQIKEQNAPPAGSQA